jgi:hypothetical protein
MARRLSGFGIVPDLVVRPTVVGIWAGSDEVLEAGVSYALGREWRLSNGLAASIDTRFRRR